MACKEVACTPQHLLMLSPLDRAVEHREDVPTPYNGKCCAGMQGVPWQVQQQHMQMQQQYGIMPGNHGQYGQQPHHMQQYGQTQARADHDSLVGPLHVQSCRQCWIRAH